jgi:CSLREA domain-containing protein
MLTSAKTIQKRVAVAAITLTVLLLGELHAATYTVTRSDDRNVSTAGCPSSGSSDCSLREAITAANDNPGADTIDIAVVSITLNIPQRFVVGGTGITLNGNGATIQRSLSAPNFSIFVIASTSPTIFNDVTIANGVEAAGLSGGGGIFVAAGTNLSINNSTIKNNSAQNGGAIYIDGNTAAAPTQVTITNSSVLNNSATDSGGSFFGGGGIYVEPRATLTLSSTAVTGNTSAENGGGLFVDGVLLVSGGQISGNVANTSGGGVFYSGAAGAATLRNTTVDGNTAQSQLGGGVYAANGTLNLSGGAFLNNRAGFEGGGVYSASASVINAVTFAANTADNGGGIINYGNMSVSNSVLRGNTAGLSGGGLFNTSAGASLTLSNSTVSGNDACATSACESGGAIYNFGGTMSLLNSTISSNRGFRAGVVLNQGSVTVRNTIIAGNRASAGGVPDVSGMFTSLGNNLIGNSFGSPSSPAPGDIVGTAAAPIDAKLRPLGNYGGATQTQPPFSDSPALNAGNNCVLVAGACGDGNPALTTDQRGLTRIGDVTSFVPDIGAVELQTAIVTNLSDYVSAATPISNTLRSFVESTFLYDRILFDPSNFTNPNTSINLLAPLTINRPLEIFGFNANSPRITGGSAQPFVVTGSGDLRLSNVSVLIGFVGSLNGGLINNAGRVSLSNCTMSLGQTNGNGGGLYNGIGATAEIDRCTFANNFASVGGAIFNLGTLKVSRSTFALNNASVGAAISSADTGPNSTVLTSVTSVTIANNKATNSSGGIRYTGTLAGSSFVLQNSIVVDNTAPVADGKPDLNGDFTSLGNNLIGRSDGGTGFVNGTSGDIVGSLAAPVTANLIASSGTGVNNGGQAFTLRPLPPSRAINNGVALGFSTDQRGFPVSVGGVADIGAVEFNMTPIGTLEGARRRLPNSTTGTSYSQKIEAFGAGSFTFTATTLPTFLTLTPSAAAPSTATLTGVPTLAQAGTYTFTITATAPASDSFTVANDYTLVVQRPAILNIDNSEPDSIYDAATDGVLLVRYFLGYRGAELIANARGSGAALRDAAQVEAHIAANAALFDVDGDGQTLPTTDGLMILRRLLNPSVSVSNASAMAAITLAAKNSARTDANVVNAIDALKP